MIALLCIPPKTQILPESFKQTFTLMLDDIQDPGNLGTIIRTADWFGFDRVICSPGTVEAYNPKVVQATMGSLARIDVMYDELVPLLRDAQIPIYGALLKGTSIYQTRFGREGIVVLGNEGNGLSDEVKKLVTHQVTIPRFGQAESLNVAVSAAIFCTKIREETEESNVREIKNGE
ncbi:RNA methyltransferase [Hufsiella ginkgonis]